MSLESSARRRPRWMGGLVSIGLAASLLVAAPVAVIGSAAPAEAATVKNCTGNAFVSQPSKHVWYRIPALAASKDATSGKTTLYAFAERRDNQTSDDGNFDIDMAKSTNGGCTWTKPVTVLDAGKYRVSNPSATVSANGTVILMATERKPIPGDSQHRVGGVITVTTSASNFQRSTDLDFRTGFNGLVGPGNGIVLNVGPSAGRVVVPIAYQSGSSYGARLLYSDDNGANWLLGGVSTTRGPQLIEPQIAQLSDGRIFVSAHDKRTLTPTTNRYYAYFTDGLSTMGGWSKLKVSVTSTQTSFITSGSVLYMVAPSYTTRQIPALRRVEAVFSSTNGGKTWSKKYQLNLDNTVGAYSDIVKLDASRFGIVYETGRTTFKERVRFMAVPIATTRKWKLVKSTISHERLSTSGVKLKVRATGSSSPWGTVSLTYTNTRTHRHGTVTKTLVNTGKGISYVPLPRLSKGRYTVVAKYSGTGRIASASIKVGTVTF